MTPLNFIKDHFNLELGNCLKCMRTAFGFFVISFVFAVGATLITESQFIIGLFWVLTFGMMSLWGAHVWAFTKRKIKPKLGQKLPGSKIPSFSQPQKGEDWTRRKFIGAFIRVLIYSAAISTFPKAAFAQDCNCPRTHPHCYFNPSSREYFCCEPNYSRGCTFNYESWCCSSNCDCYGPPTYCGGCR